MQSTSIFNTIMPIKKIISSIMGLFFLGHIAILQAQSLAPRFNNLGAFHHKISTNNPLAQAYFNQGLVLFYGFEWGEAIRSFKAATSLDPNCGMCYWGLALSLGNLINAPLTGQEYKEAQVAIKKALLLNAHLQKKEQEYIKALSLLFKHAPKISNKAGAFSCHLSSSKEDKPSKEEMLAYSNAMKKISKAYPDDNDAKALYAFALFNQINWAFWDANGKINPLTPTLLKTLRSVLAKDPTHSGANHYFIHVVEQSQHPEEAINNANRLRTLVPDSEHLVHMPAHIYFLTGRYHQGSEANLKAIKIFQKYNQTCIKQGFKPEISYLYFHNYDFLRTTASMEGRKKLALFAANQIIDKPFSELLAKEPSLQWFIPIPSFVKARFGMWNELLGLPKPKPEYQYALGMWYYTQGMALIHTNHSKDAEKALSNLKTIVAKGKTDSTLGKQGHNLLKIAHEILAASITNFQKNEAATFAHLKLAAKIQKDMGYHEPPDWYFPVKEILGNAYLKWGHSKEAIAMYEQDLKQYPKNAWALYGLAQAFQASGNKKKAAEAQQAFEEAWKDADISVPVTLFK